MKKKSESPKVESPAEEINRLAHDAFVRDVLREPGAGDNLVAYRVQAIIEYLSKE